MIFCNPAVRGPAHSLVDTVIASVVRNLKASKERDFLLARLNEVRVAIVDSPAADGGQDPPAVCLATDRLLMLLAPAAAAGVLPSDVRAQMDEVRRILKPGDPDARQVEAPDLADFAEAGRQLAGLLAQGAKAATAEVVKKTTAPGERRRKIAAVIVGAVVVAGVGIGAALYVRRRRRRFYP